MGINRNLPEIKELKAEIEKKANLKPVTHDDFVYIRETIYNEIKEQISETTLERIWGYSTRGYNNISTRILGILCVFLGYKSWLEFLDHLKESKNIESDVFDLDSLSTDELNKGDRIIIGWQPNRRCKLKYLGNNRFETLEAINSKLQPGDTFSCLQFQLSSPLFAEELRSADGILRGKRYGIGLKNGLTILQRSDD